LRQRVNAVNEKKIGQKEEGIEILRNGISILAGRSEGKSQAMKV